MKHHNFSPIGEKLKRISSYRVQKKELYYWKNGWRMKHFPLLDKIRSLAVQSNNQELIYLVNQLELLDSRCFDELDELIGIVSDPRRRLDDTGTMRDLYYEFHVQQQYDRYHRSNIRESKIPETDIQESESWDEITQEGIAQESKNLESNTIESRIREPNIQGSGSRESIVPEPDAQESAAETKPAADSDTLIENMTRSYQDGMSVNQISQTYHVTIQKVIKILVTQDVYSSTHYNKIKELRNQGKSDQEIAELLHISRRTMFCYTPYKRSIMI